MSTVHRSPQQYLWSSPPLVRQRSLSAFPSDAACADRVVPGHSFKFASELQHQLGGEAYQTAPLLIRIESNAGHGSGKPTAMIIKEAADKYAFMGRALHAKWN